jgi:hypothetical protein
MLQNFFSAKNFEFSMSRLPNVEFFVQAASIPGLSIPVTEQYTPFAPIARPGSKLQFDEFSITIRLDEKLECFKEIYNWMVGMTSPNSFTQYAGLVTGDGVFSDASLIVLNSKGNAIIEFKFKDLFPIGMSPIQMNVNNSTTEFATTTVTFKYTTYEIVDI